MGETSLPTATDYAMHDARTALQHTGELKDRVAQLESDMEHMKRTVVSMAMWLAQNFTDASIMKGDNSSEVETDVD